jgi:Protein tyrosine and serine/threonine kinase
LGITLQEIFAYGAQPFHDLSSNVAVLSAVLIGKRPTCPKDCPTEVFSFICTLWEQEPEDRPGVASVVKSLERLLADFGGDSPDASGQEEQHYCFIPSSLRG